MVNDEGISVIDLFQKNETNPGYAKHVDRLYAGSDCPKATAIMEDP